MAREQKGRRLARVGPAARRAWPVILMAWERWQALPPEQRERYLKQARGYAERGRKAVEKRRKRRGK
jgi:TRAP-type C4-dicarboxylate transport system substrate-binding protein